MQISEFERTRRRRLQQWNQINAALGVGSLALFVVALLLAAYALVPR